MEEVDKGLLACIIFYPSEWLSLSTYHSHEGIDAGGPPFPLIFTIVAQGFDKLIMKDKVGSLIRGFEVGRDELFSHLQFADDPLLFL